MKYAECKPAVRSMTRRCDRSDEAVTSELEEPSDYTSVAMRRQWR
jgi:hypothetical protein